MTEKDKAEELKGILQGKKGAHTSSHRTEKPVAPKETEPSPELEVLKKEVEEQKERYLRVAAEFENYKKRTQKEKEEFIQFGNERLVHDLLAVLDDLDRVLDHLPEQPTDEFKHFAEGVEIARRHFWSVLTKAGVKEVEALGQIFDPHRHEAMAQVESEGKQSGEVVDQHRKGYSFKDRLLRPALVTVAK